MGDLVFELYRNKVPHSVDNILANANGEKSYKGTALNKGYPGVVLQGGRIGDACAEVRHTDENLELRHFKRGQLTMANNGENSNGSEFMITLGKADMLDGYHQVVGELVEGEDVLREAEQSVTRHGTVADEIRIENSGTR